MLRPYSLFQMQHLLAGTFLLVFGLSCSDGGLGPEPPGGGPEPPILPRHFDYPAWHPDGGWIAAEHSESVDSDGNGQPDSIFGGIWLVNAERGDKQLLIGGFGSPAWSPDGRKLAMGAGGQIFTIEVTSVNPAQVDSASLVQLTFEGGNFFPTWSPDGEWIAYDSNVNDPNGAHVIWRMRSDGSGKRDISQHGVGEWRMPDWSPEGGHIVHQRYVDVDAPEIVTMDTAGGNPFRLTNDDRLDALPRYSPDGSRIAFYSQPPIGPPSLWLVRVAESRARELWPPYAWRFDWSPDGKRLVFLYWDFLNWRPGNGQLWVMNIDGSGLHQITF